MTSTATLPRVLTGIPPDGFMSLAQHEATHGAMPVLARGRHDNALELELTESGLRGQGGAAFPTAIKLQAVARARGRAVVVANGCEGDPASSKDRLLLERLPHLVIDGALLAARAGGASDIVIAVGEHAPHARRAVEVALSERHDRRSGTPRVRVVTVPHGYVSGQEAALVNFLNGGPAAKPTAIPPRVYERGVGGRPTLVDNVETLAHVALIARHGAAWFREIGTTEDPGSRLVSVSGAFAAPGVYEIECGAPLSALVSAAGGFTTSVQALLLGGYAGTWVEPERGMQLGLGETQLATSGATLGAGIVVALPTSACAVAEVARIAGWLSEEGAGQCGPCVNGLGSIAATLQRVQDGTAGDAPLEQLARWSSLVRGRGACGHPDGVAKLVESALSLFAAEFADHARHGICEGCARRRILPISRPLARRMAA
jgi:NADH:ubiquinone oxidoreductase subunit F (NADH-binding)